MEVIERIDKNEENSGWTKAVKQYNIVASIG